MGRINFFTEYGEANRYKVHEVIGKGSYGLVCSAIDTQTGEWVAIKKINDVFEHVSDAIRILREIKLLRLLRHPDIVQLKHILLPPSPREFKDVYVVFELMESDLHQVIKANDDLTREHFRFFLYQLLRALKYLHTANVFHRDLKPKNILANSDCKLKICDFGLARVTFTGSSSAIFWTDYVATRWYRAPELCGSFTTKYTTAIDIWSIGCIFAEVLTGRPLFPGRNVAHQLDLITDLLGTPPPEVIAKVRNEKARRYLSSLRKKNPVPFHQKFPRVDPMALRLLQRLLAFDAKDRPTAEEALADPYFRGLAKLDREPTSPPTPKGDFEFERQHLTKEDVRELIYREILEYHPQMLKQYMNTREQSRFMYPSAVDQLKRQFDCLQNKSKEPVKTLIERKPTSLPRERVVDSRDEVKKNVKETNNTNNGKKKNNDNKVHNIETIKANINNSRPLQDKNTTQNRENTIENKAPLVPYKHSQGESLKNTKVVVRSNLPTKEETQKDSSYVKKLIKSASMGLSQQVVPTQSQTRTTAPNAKNEQDDKKSVMKSRTRSMGVTVAKMVAAFSNGLAHS